MNSDPEDSADRSKRFTQNNNRTGLLSDINTKREVKKPARNAVSEYSVSPYSCPLRVCLSPLASLISLNFFPDFSNFFKLRLINNKQISDKRDDLSTVKCCEDFVLFFVIFSQLQPIKCDFCFLFLFILKYKHLLKFQFVYFSEDNYALSEYKKAFHNELPVKQVCVFSSILLKIYERLRFMCNPTDEFF